VPVRVAEPVFPVTLKVTVAAPVPLAAPLIVSQLVLLLVAVHAQPAAVVTLVVVVAGFAVSERLVGLSENEQLTPC
jgi:hypothetical protein